MAKIPELNAANINKKIKKTFLFVPMKIKGSDLEEQEFAVVARPNDFRETDISDDSNILSAVLSLETDVISKQVRQEFDKALALKDAELKKIIGKYDIEELTEKCIDETITKDERKALNKYNEITDDFIKVRIEIIGAIKDRIKEHREYVRNNLSLEDIGAVTQAIKLYIGNFFFWKMVDIWNVIMTEIQDNIKDLKRAGEEYLLEDQRQQIRERINKQKYLFSKATLMDELLNGKEYNKNRPERGAYGGIASFLDFIQVNDNESYNEIQEYLDWIVKEATKQLRMTPEKNLRLYKISLGDEKDTAKKTTVTRGKKSSLRDNLITPEKTTSKSVGVKPAKKLPPLESEKDRYSTILQGKATNALAHAAKKKFKKDELSQVVSTEENGITIFLRSDNNLIISVNTKKVLDILTIKLTEQIPYGKKATSDDLARNREVELSVSDYMRICDIKDRKEASKQLTQAIQTLFDVNLEWIENRLHVPKGKKKAVYEPYHWQARILEAVGRNFYLKPVQNGKVVVQFTYNITEYLSQAYPMQFPQNLFVINSHKHRNSYYLGRKLAEHHNMNSGKGNENRVSVMSLINACPSLPSYEDVMERDGAIKKRIIDPFERDLMALKNEYNVLSEWHYCNNNGTSLTDEQIERYDYNTWAKWLVEFELIDYPDQSKRLAKKRKERN